MSSVPSEIVEQYKAGNREIYVSPEVFKAYDDYLIESRGFLTRIEPSDIALPRSLRYKAAQVRPRSIVASVRQEAN